MSPMKKLNFILKNLVLLISKSQYSRNQIIMIFWILF